MQLILTHADLELALIESLRSKGMTAFEPGKASVEFTFKRGTKELQCVLDTEPKAPVEATTTKATSVVAEPEAPAPAAEPEPEAPAQEPASEQSSTAEPAGQLADSAAADDNLFD